MVPERRPLPDEYPVVLCRVHVPERMRADVDGWMPKHFDDALRHPAVRAAANYAVRQDWSRLPSVFNGDCTRFIPYAYASVEGLTAAIDGPAAREAIKDGAEREGQYPLLDGEPFNGTSSRTAPTSSRPSAAPRCVTRSWSRRAGTSRFRTCGVTRPTACSCAGSSRSFNKFRQN